MPDAPSPRTPLSALHHAVPLLLAAVVLGLAFTLAHHLSLPARWRLGLVLSWAMPLAVLGWTVHRIVRGRFDLRTDLPLDVCNAGGVLAPLVFLTGHPLLAQVLVYTALGGTTQAVLTPDLDEGYPHPTYLKYWVVHLGLVVCGLFLVVLLGARPTLQGLVLTLAVLDAYLIALFGVNHALHANYGYVNRKPDNPTVLDRLPPWPWYLLVGQALAIGLGVLVWLAFAFIPALPLPT